MDIWPRGCMQIDVCWIENKWEGGRDRGGCDDDGGGLRLLAADEEKGNVLVFGLRWWAIWSACWARVAVHGIWIYMDAATLISQWIIWVGLCDSVLFLSFVFSVFFGFFLRKLSSWQETTQCYDCRVIIITDLYSIKRMHQEKWKYSKMIITAAEKSK